MARAPADSFRAPRTKDVSRRVQDLPHGSNIILHLLLTHLDLESVELCYFIFLVILNAVTVAVRSTLLAVAPTSAPEARAARQPFPSHS